jgi:hypothetical protein
VTVWGGFDGRCGGVSDVGGRRVGALAFPRRTPHGFDRGGSRHGTADGGSGCDRRHAVGNVIEGSLHESRSTT